MNPLLLRCLLLTVLASSLQAQEMLSLPLAHASDIRTLSAEAANRKLPVDLRGVVTYVDTGSGDGQLFVQDNTAGIFVFQRGAKVSAPLHAGQFVEIKGVTTAGDFSPCIAQPRITVMREGEFPTPKRPAFDQFLATREDGQWTELRGVVRSGETKAGRLFLNVAVPGGSFLAIAPHYRDDWKKAFVDSVVTVTGALAPIRNEFRQAVGVRLFVPDQAHIHIVEPAPSDPFDQPSTDAGSVGGFRPTIEFEHRIRVKATVTAAETGVIYVSDGRGNLAVQGPTGCDLSPGDIADIVGFPGPVYGRPGLQDAQCRRLSAGGAPKVVATTADAILPEQNFNDPSGVGQAAATRFDMKPIRIEGTLLQASPGPDSYVLILESGKRQFVATLPRSAKKFALQSAANGDRIQLTGICLITYDQYHRGQSFRILLRDATDIVVTATAPWWNSGTAMWVLGLMGGFVLLSATWIVVLRHEVRASTVELRKTNELLQRLSCEDALTGAANRRQFDMALHSEFGRTRRSAMPISLLLIDIDHFKARNDRFGHLRGDECLARVARTLKAVLPKGIDQVARYGGEEFAVILPETDSGAARLVAEKMRKAVEGLAIANPVETGHPFLSVSVGVATFHPLRSGAAEYPSPEVLIGLADEGLYQAKQGGRNRCISLEETAGRQSSASPAGLRNAI
jgi:diguanylate cyclase (GGDEF)-like protein